MRNIPGINLKILKLQWNTYPYNLENIIKL
uniref:Uncharacterized protein n=1 Tax=Heterorhabditis bacteriophora TaxID=37862 RepID=A0A1I7X2V0_HETBA